MSVYSDTGRPRVCRAYVGPFHWWLITRPGRGWVFATTWREAVAVALDWWRTDGAAS